MPEPERRPGVSVVIATRDRPELLARAVDSIMASAYAGPIEVIVVFDQADPHDVATARPPGEGRTVRVLRNERTDGLAGARNTGIASSRWDLVAFCDDDDEWRPAKLERQVRAMTDGVLVVATGITVIYEGHAHDRLPGTDRVTLDDLLRSRATEIHPSSLVFSKDALLGPIGLVDEQIPGSYGEDYDLLLRSAKQGPIEVVDAPLVIVHWHRSSWFSDRWTTIIQAITYLLQRHPEFERSPEGRARLYGRMAFAYAASGDRANARTWAKRALRLNRRERRAYLAWLVSTGLVSAATLMRLANRTGRGI
jgi:GT2 family glycosyltransferase